jgi:hypothetical protein
MPPTINLTSPIRITLPINEINRDYRVAVGITPSGDTNITDVNAVIYSDNSSQSIPISDGTITIPIPNDVTNSVGVM